MSAPHLRTTSSALQRAQSLLTKPFTYDLPQSHIATHPLADRSSSKLLIVPRGRQPSHAKFNQLPSLLPENSLLLLNSSRVIPARIQMRKPSGGKAELLLLNHATDGTACAMFSRLHSQRWHALVGGKNIRVGHALRLPAGSCCDVEAHVLERHQNHAVVDFQCPSHADTLRLAEFLNQHGSPPLPPYMKRPSNSRDTQTYQTVYASEHGSVAAPTAGLHITEKVLDQIEDRGIRTREIVLHIGIGTFQQVETPIAGTHDMHEESLSVSGEVIADICEQLRNRAPIVAVVRS
ncbi:S-adenosylmethionine:tRNA ribosyltransferase-isomerase [Gracilaria domingensis]|nr:S-adenosylmethionine:tRNA ribosyltransferase-isomerase [Gracilaria domingensis]